MEKVPIASMIHDYYCMKLAGTFNVFVTFITLNYIYNIATKPNIMLTQTFAVAINLILWKYNILIPPLVSPA